MHDKINVKLKIWRQKDGKSKGKFETYRLKDLDTSMSFLEMLDVLNEDLASKGAEPVEFDHDCREGICGMCGAVVNGQAHGPVPGTTFCQLHLRHFKNNAVITIEPWRSRAFPVVKDLVVDRSSFDRIITAGGYISAKTGSAPEANAIPVSKENADLAMDAAACIGCGACVAACPNASAMLFVGAKISHLALLPHGQIERKARALNMVEQMDKEGFGNCSNEYECEAACPKQIKVSNIARMNKEFRSAAV
ncbi:MAG: succinate dehydrogenase/fumarate reductase iron-sulfur subunit [Candidatus Omnitrophota bacterium]|nr:succinate dehydrogenase/fumarate reductase iron-sulfur subunit [Candidatus Omnitrophota bacterium]MDZ4243173.1 succinate dehydrogenase/fumarate reductase iron-sulfur subunit [Candidatus Omnitrophota bacterium]